MTSQRSPLVPACPPSAFAWLLIWVVSLPQDTLGRIMGQPGKKGPQNIQLDFLMGQDKSLALG